MICIHQTQAMENLIIRLKLIVNVTPTDELSLMFLSGGLLMMAWAINTTKTLLLIQK